MPEDISPMNAEIPSWHERNSLRTDGRVGIKRRVFFFVKKCAAQMVILMTGESPVASAAPGMPIRSGNINR